MSLLLLAFSLHASARELVLTLANSPPMPGVISTGNSEGMTLRVISGHEVAFARASGRDYQLQGGGGFRWTQVQSVPLNAESVSLSPTLEEDGSVAVSLDVARKQGADTLRYSTTLAVQPGEWVKLFGPAESQAGNSKVYGTQKQPDEALYLRIEY